MNEETTYRCINPACASTMPRAVAFCPYCGTDQSGRVAAAAPQQAVAPPPQAAAPVPPPPPAPPAAPNEPVRQSQAVPPGTGFGHGARTAPPPPQAPTPQAAPTPPTPPTPPIAPARRGMPNIWGRGPSAPPAPAERGPGGREPVKLRYWLVVLAVLAGVWWWAKPSAHKVEKRIAHAVALAHACKAREAQDELLALRADRATPEQLEGLQSSLNDEAAACTRKRQRDKAWRDTGDAVDAALSTPTAASLDRARGRLQAFTRRYGEDQETRMLRDRIDAARHPLADPDGQ